MLGGAVTNDDGLATATNNVYIFNVTHNTIVSYWTRPRLRRRLLSSWVVILSVCHENSC